MTHPLFASLFGFDVASDPLFVAFLAGCAFAFGAVIGSFLNVCISRLPAMSIAAQWRSGDETVRREISEGLDEDPAKGRAAAEALVAENVNLARPRSRCPKCKTLIAWYDNVPLAAWLLLRGRCRHCGQRISPLYPAVELLSGLAAAYLLLRFGPAVGPVYFAVYCAMLVITGVDLAIFEIPDEIVLPGIPLGLIATFVTPVTLQDAAIGAAVGAALPYAIARGYQLIMKREGMGFGDVKMLAMIGAFFGWRGVIAILLIASLAGSVIGLSLIIFTRREARALIPFGPFLALGTIIYMLYGPQLTDLYSRYGS